MKKSILSLLIASTLIGCGGGGDSKPSNPPTDDSKPLIPLEPSVPTEPEVIPPTEILPPVVPPTTDCGENGECLEDDGFTNPELPNQPPVGVSVYFEMYAGTTQDLKLEATDVDGDDFSFNVVDVPDWAWFNGVDTLTLNPTKDHLGQHVLKFYVHDGHNDPVEFEASVNVKLAMTDLEPSEPTNVGPIAEMLGEEVETINTICQSYQCDIMGDEVMFTKENVTIYPLRASVIIDYKEDGYQGTYNHEYAYTAIGEATHEVAHVKTDVLEWIDNNGALSIKLEHTFDDTLKGYLEAGDVTLSSIFHHSGDQTGSFGVFFLSGEKELGSILAKHTQPLPTSSCGDNLDCLEDGSFDNSQSGTDSFLEALGVDDTEWYSEIDSLCTHPSAVCGFEDEQPYIEWQGTKHFPNTGKAVVTGVVTYEFDQAIASVESTSTYAYVGTGVTLSTELVNQSIQIDGQEIKLSAETVIGRAEFEAMDAALENGGSVIVGANTNAVLTLEDGTEISEELTVGSDFQTVDGENLYKLLRMKAHARESLGDALGKVYELPEGVGAEICDSATCEFNSQRQAIVAVAYNTTMDLTYPDRMNVVVMEAEGSKAANYKLFNVNDFTLVFGSGSEFSKYWEHTGSWSESPSHPHVKLQVEQHIPEELASSIAASGISSINFSYYVTGKEGYGDLFGDTAITFHDDTAIRLIMKHITLNN